ncbi:protein of unknown function [Taphrina deformans PYCC 5710]|uniref:ubiquitinyl hydrolase 1 n=1 Tax=Taphrina deformans (strain PYCC 5710 / ATCC 11124 / CBS 356.35 / IMI 108563 / JCM 9778 / NBRC 8474) TaxID=1097556 RepID=R4XE44_TAPDE|nr:protein of unknown function [Taphrina deformans PYCC 5710]|eukprot:CCG83937.1 protein of unknown function [Taphrina deformans PYCC 5710]
MVEIPEIRIAGTEDETDSVVVADDVVRICPHLKKACRFRRIEPKIRDLKAQSSRICKSCAKETDRASTVPESAQLWLCLGCGGLYCGRYDKGHAGKHYEKLGDNDCMMWNIESFNCWCYLCDDSVRTAPNRNEALVQVEKYWLKHAEASAAPTFEVAATPAKDLTYKVITPGLQNLGNTCFFNSVIQLLASVEQLHEIVSPHPFRERSPLEIKSTSGLTMAFSKVLNEIYSSEREKIVIKPGALFGEVHSKFPQFTRGVQQDAQELLHYLLEGLKADETMDKPNGRPCMKRTRSRRRTTGEEEFEMTERVVEKKKQDAWVPANYIESIFEGRLASIVICSTCKSISTTYDQFEELSLSIVQEKAPVKERKGRFRSALTDIGRKSRNSLSLTRGPSSRRGSSTAPSIGKAESDHDTEGRSIKIPQVSPSQAAPISVSEAVSEEEAEDAAAVEKQLKAHTFSMSEAKNRLLSFATARKSSVTTLSPDEALSPSTTIGSATSSLPVSGIPPPSLERMSYIERLLQEPESVDLVGSIEDSLRDFTAVESLENENAFACEECAKLLYPQEIKSPTAQDPQDPQDGAASMEGVLAENNVGEQVTPVTSGESMQIDSPTGEATNVRAPRHIMRKAYKRFLVADFPNIMILHLKRFQQSGKSIYSSMRKNDAVVTFDEEVDMTPYMMPTAGTDQEGQVAPQVRYRCVGAIVHIGTINSGHYVAYFLSHKTVGTGASLTNEAGSKERRWVFASDAMTRPCSWTEVSKSRAYMIFYERIV